ncbi:MAG: hypothetical protein ACI9MR_002897 [Myxococcota bacterium]|jgi:hypothetical protein
MIRTWLRGQVIEVGRRLSTTPAPVLAGQDWVQADPDRIAGLLARSQALPSGGWYVVDAVRQLATQPKAYRIAGRDLVFWRDGDGKTHAAPDACPHMGASLADGHVERGKLVCPWHALALDHRGFRDWQCLPVHDDGVLFWVQLRAGADKTAAPIIAPRPARFIDGTIRVEGHCAPEDIIANRLDPWHGAHFHPYAFADLTVVGLKDDVLSLRVSYKVGGPLRVTVDATFHTPDPRTIVMTITDGDGAGSVVETHATPIDPGRTAVIETTLATSDRSGFSVAHRGARVLRPLIRAAARRLWVDDIAYAERLYALRQRSVQVDGKPAVARVV